MPTLIQVVAATGQTVYIFIFNGLGQVWSVAHSAFEVYNVANWAQYVIAAPEKTGSGNYFANIPIGITAPGLYSWTGYIQLGANPASGDTPVDQGNFQFYPTGGSQVVPTGLAALITSLRTLAEDNQDSKVVYGEQLGGSDQPAFPVDGNNTLFRLQNAPLSDFPGAPIFSWATIIGAGATRRSQAIFNIVDQIAGIIQFTNPPNPGGNSPPNGVFIDYNYQWFTDAKYAEFLNQAAQMTVAGVSAPTAVQEGLKEAMLEYALSKAMYSLAARFAMQFQSNGGEASVQPQSKSAQFRAIAKDAAARGDALKKDFYQRQGSREAPAYGDPRSFPPPRFNRITPRR